jgi:membrane peptidoglycan carboxypeptidase
MLKTTALLKLIVVVVATGLVASLFFVPYIAGIGMASNTVTSKFLNEKCTLKPATLDQTTSIYARDGKTLIATLFKDDRKPVTLKTVPKLAQLALIDTEDRRFYSHHGLDLRGLARAAVNDSGANSTQGASTLTQQLVKQTRLYDAGSNVALQKAATAQTTERKIYEAKCALKLEQELTKNQILEQYLNIAYYGEQSYGIATAARNYFGLSSPAKLTVPQAAMLAGLVRSPGSTDPFTNYTAARDRRNEVIDNMVIAGDLTAAQGRRYKATGLGLDDTNHAHVGAQGCAYARDDLIKNVGFFCDYALKWLTTTGGLTYNQVQTGGYKIVTSIDPALQNTATAKEWKAFPASSPTALVQPSVDPSTGEITSFITNKRYNYQNKHSSKNASYTSVPLFTNATGGSGSTYKLFTLVAALTAGVPPTQSVTTSGPKYFPKNCGDWVNKNPANGITVSQSEGATNTLSTGFIKSSNSFFVGVEDQIFDCDLSTIVKTAQTLGVTAFDTVPRKNNPKHLTIAQQVVQGNQYTFTLGQDSISPLELTRAYSAVANDGTLCQSRPILSITASNGKTVPFKQATCARKMSKWVARTAVKIMVGVTTQGTARNDMYNAFYDNHSPDKYPVGGKTGTNNATDKNGKDNKENAALWFVGVTPNLVAASAMFDPNSPTHSIRGVPGFPGAQAAKDAYGSVSSVFWAKSFASTVTKHSWSWPTANSFDGAEQVPSVRGRSVDDAVQRLKDAGFKPEEYPIHCGSGVIPGFVAFAGPGYAAKGDTVYYCVSDGKSLVSRPKPRVVTPPKNNTPPTTTPPTTPPTTTPPTTTTPPKTTPPKATPPKATPPKKKNPPKRKKPGPGPTDGGLGH